jgi:DNA-binding GntR family transcriptional regulator
MKSLQQQAYDHIKNMIVRNELMPEMIYSETKIAQEIGISRTPCRDAIHRLVQDGYLDIIPSTGFRIHQLTKQDVDDTIQMRSAIEGYCTLQIARECRSHKALMLFSDLDEMVFQMSRIIKTNRSIDAFWDYDQRFHIAIVQYMENQIFNHIFDTYMYRIQRLATLSFAHENRMENALAEHNAILTAMKEGNTSDIVGITLTHMENPRMIVNQEVLQNL